MRNKQNMGFSLIELMVVIAIIGILTSIALGFYGDNVIAAGRSEARSALTSTAGSLEKCKSLYGAYNNANCAVAATLPLTTDANLYTITANPATTATTFTLLATPVAGESQANDADCTTLSLNNTGVESATGANTAVCWN